MIKTLIFNEKSLSQRVSLGNCRYFGTYNQIFINHDGLPQTLKVDVLPQKCLEILYRLDRHRLSIYHLETVKNIDSFCHFDIIHYLLFQEWFKFIMLSKISKSIVSPLFIFWGPFWDHFYLKVSKNPWIANVQHCTSEIQENMNKSLGINMRLFVVPSEHPNFPRTSPKFFPISGTPRY